ncbi:MAG: hypothetical protein WBI58_02055, partial [Dysgonamonadaceae bacterium]
SSLHACIRLASSSHEVRSVRTTVSRFKYGKEAGLFYTGLTESDVVVPALKRRKSEQGAKEERRISNKKPAKTHLSDKNFVNPNIENCHPFCLTYLSKQKRC